MRASCGSAHGFTLVETMVAGTILMSMSLLAALWLTGVSDLWWTAHSQSEARTVSHLAVNRLVAELRSGTRRAGGSPPNAVIPAAPGNIQVTFFLPADLDGNGTIIDAIGEIEWDNANPVQYVHVPAQLQLQRLQGGLTRVLADGVQSATFEDATVNPALLPDEIRVTLTLQRRTPRGRTVSATSVETLKLRN